MEAAGSTEKRPTVSRSPLENAPQPPPAFPTAPTGPATTQIHTSQYRGGTKMLDDQPQETHEPLTVATLRRVITISGIADHHERNWRSRSAEHAVRAYDPLDDRSVNRKCDAWGNE